MKYELTHDEWMSIVIKRKLERGIEEHKANMIKQNNCEHNYIDNSEFHEGHYTYICSKCGRKKVVY